MVHVTWSVPRPRCTLQMRQQLCSWQQAAAITGPPIWLPPCQMLRPALILVLQGGKASGGLSCSGLQRLVVVMLQLSRDPGAQLLAGLIEVRWQQPSVPP